MASQHAEDWSKLTPVGAAAAAAPNGANQATREQRRKELIKAQDDARANPEFQKDAKGRTHCNAATLNVAQSVGAPTGPLVDKHGAPLPANDMAKNLAKSKEYSEVTPDKAQQIADQGGLAIAAYDNPKGHGHVVTVRPCGVDGDKPVGKSGPVLNDIGAYDRIDRHSKAFRKGSVVRYYTPQ
jgi:hypothetical protein